MSVWKWVFQSDTEGDEMISNILLLLIIISVRSRKPSTKISLSSQDEHKFRYCREVLFVTFTSIAVLVMIILKVQKRKYWDVERVV